MSTWASSSGCLPVYFKNSQFFLPACCCLANHSVIPVLIWGMWLQAGICSPGGGRFCGDRVWGCKGGCLSDQPPHHQVHPLDRLLRYLRRCRLGKAKEGTSHMRSESFCTWSTNQKGGSGKQKNHYSECWTHSHASHLQSYIHTHMSISNSCTQGEISNMCEFSTM